MLLQRCRLNANSTFLKIFLTVNFFFRSLCELSNFVCWDYFRYIFFEYYLFDFFDRFLSLFLTYLCHFLFQWFLVYFFRNRRNFKIIKLTANKRKEMWDFAFRISRKEIFFNFSFRMWEEKRFFEIFFSHEEKIKKKRIFTY